MARAKAKERRTQREAEKQKRWAAKRQKSLDSLGLTQTPSSVVEVPERQPRLAPHLQREAIKEPRVTVTAHRYQQRMTWCHAKSDQVGQWTWGDPRAWTDEEWNVTIQPNLDHLSKLSWKEIEQMSSGSGRRRKTHHSHEIEDLVGEAQRRWVEIGLEQFDKIFRFRIGGQKCRAWGFIVQAHFHLVWWDRTHKIFPTDRN